MARLSGATILGGSGTNALSAERKLTSEPMRPPTEAAPCHDPRCKPKGVVLEIELRFKNNAKRIHDHDIRPMVTIEARCDQLEDHPECARDGRLTYPYRALKYLGHFEAAVGSQASFKPSQDHSTYLELEETLAYYLFLCPLTFMEDSSRHNDLLSHYVSRGPSGLGIPFPE
ncbi:hypothetical protein F4859DRAFT_519996 [Xylaria cf. heliscus]|nr:hypothetical protein F4859DRAFT_519996 [Xylaria cf. heliscus]